MTEDIWQQINKNIDKFDFFDEVYLFGSILYSDLPNDVDVLLIYEDWKLPQIHRGKKEVAKVLSKPFNDLPLDFTTLSYTELAETNFLEKVMYRRLK